MIDPAGQSNETSPSDTASPNGETPSPIGETVGADDEDLLTPSVPKDDEEDEPGEDWFADLQDEVRKKGPSPVIFLPVLSLEGYIRKNRSHLLASYPKGGKTELLVQVIMGWPEETVLYISEESRETWQNRAYELPDWGTRMRTVYALGKSYDWILARATEWDGTAIVIDTIKLLGIEDENDAAKVQAGLSPFITLCRAKKQTLILVTHDNKHGGKGGRGIAGSHAFVGIVDIFLELEEVRGKDRQRTLSGRGKIRTIEPLLVEMQPDGRIRPLGTEGDDSRLLTALTKTFETTAVVAGRVGVSPATAERHLKAAAGRGVIERDPPISDAKAKGKRVTWRMPENFPTEIDFAPLP